MFAHKGRDKEIAVIIAGLHSKRALLTDLSHLNEFSYFRDKFQIKDCKPKCKRLHTGQIKIE